MNNIENTDKLPVDDQKRLRVHLVPMPSGDNPWHTREDYLKDQKRGTIRFYIIIGAFVISVIAATLSYVQISEARKERIKAEEAFATAVEAQKQAEQALKETQNLISSVARIHVENVMSRGRLYSEPSPDQLKKEIDKLRGMLSKAKLEKKIIDDIVYPIEKRIENDLKRKSNP